METTIILAIIIPLFVSLIAYSASLTLKHIKYIGTIKDLNETLSATRAKLTTFDKEKNQEISDIKEMSDARINELTETIANLQSEITHLKSPSHADKMIGDFFKRANKKLTENSSSSIDKPLSAYYLEDPNKPKENRR